MEFLSTRFSLSILAFQANQCEFFVSVWCWAYHTLMLKLIQGVYSLIKHKSKVRTFLWRLLGLPFGVYIIPFISHAFVVMRNSGDGRIVATLEVVGHQTEHNWVIFERAISCLPLSTKLLPFSCY